MQKFSDVINTVRQRPVPGAKIVVDPYVLNAGANTSGVSTATIYATDGGPAVPFVLSDGAGRFSFYAADGRYNLTVTGADITPYLLPDVVLDDPSDDAELTGSFFQIPRDGVTDAAAAIERARTFCRAAGKQFYLEGGSYFLSRHVYFSEQAMIRMARDVVFTAKKIIVSGMPSSQHYKNDLRPHPDSGKLGTYQRVRTTFGFHLPPAMNNQGLSYWAGFYYVGFDLGGGNGQVNRYFENGDLDASYGGVSVPTRHTAELAYRVTDGRIYAASGGGAEPTYVYRLAADGKSVDQTLDFTATGNAALLAIDNNNDLLLLHTTGAGGDSGPIDFRLIDWTDANRVIAQFQIANQGVPQGLDIYDSVIYYYTNNKITLLDYAGNILDVWKVNAAGESEGLTVVHNYAEPCIAVGYNATPRIYTIRPPGSTSVFKAINAIGSWNRAVTNAGASAGPDITLVPSVFSASFRKQGAAPTNGWKVSTFANGNHTYNDVLNAPIVSATEVRFKFKRVFFQSIAAVHCTAHYLSPYVARADYDESTQEIVLRLYTFAGVLVDPTGAADNIIWLTIMGGVRFDNY